MKRLTFLLLMLVMALGMSAQDKKVAFYKATVDNNQYQSGEGPEKAIDGDYSTLWHSPYSGTRFPIKLTTSFRQKTHVDYVRYVPRQSGENGNWSKVKVEYSTSATGGTFVTVGTFNPNGSSSALDIPLGEGGVECGQIRFTIESGLYGWASAAEIEAYVIDNTKYDAFAQYFTDDLFTELKPEVTSAEGIEDADAKALVNNLLKNAADYKKFRVGEYEAYMPTSTLRNMLKVSSQYNNYENPTGVYLKVGEKCIVMASGIGSDAVGLKIKNWVENENSSEYSLRNGINYITATSEGNVFVNYYTNNFETAPNVKLHFINAPVQGYWDQETMTNADWRKLLSGRSTSDNTILITRSKHAQLAYPVSAWLEYCPSNIDSTMTLYQQVQWAERDILGLERYGKQVKNRQLFYATTYGFMAAGGEGSYCNVTSLGGIMRPDSKNFDFWGVGHEWGHNNQVTPGFKWSGCGETTNNIYAAWAQLNFSGNRHSLRLEDEYSGVNDYSGTRGGRMQTYFEEALRKGVAWQLQDGPDYHGATPNTITVQGQDANGNTTGTVTTTSRNYDHFVKLVPFWQLTLWGTLAGKCPDIVPMVIESIRTTDNYGSTYNTNGKQQVNWMKLACDSTKLNLLPFFEKAGMLRPINAYIEDYGAGWNIITEQMINKLKSHVANQGYAEVTEELNYINAHNFHIYRDNLKLDVPATLGTGCSYKNGKVKVSHAQVKNAVAFETYNTAGKLVRITMYGLDSDDNHSFTQVLYPGSNDEAEAAAYIMAVGYDGTRAKIYENINIQKSLSDNHYYRLVSNAKGGALSSGVSTVKNEDGSITWALERATESATQLDQIWQWKKVGDKTYLYNPQSDSYFTGSSNSSVSQLVAAADAKAWDAVCVDEAKQLYIFNMSGTGDYLNSYSNTSTGFWGGGESDANNIWKVEEVTSVSLSVPAAGYIGTCYPFAVTIPEGLEAYVVSSTANSNFEGAAFDYAMLKKVEGNIIPANMPVIYKGAKGTYTMNFVVNDATAATTPNLLKGTLLKQKVNKGTVLSVISGTTEGGATALIKGTASISTVVANRAYLLKEEVGGLMQLLFKEETADAPEVPGDDDEPGDSTTTDASTNPADYANIVYGENVETRAGSEFVLPIMMRNTEDIISFQVDLCLPQGFTAKVDEDGYHFIEGNSDRLKRSFTLESSTLPDGNTRIICYSSKNDAIIGTEGEVFNITLIANDTIADGDYEISYKKIVMTKNDAATAFEVAHVKSVVTVTSVMLGDVNEDGKINVSDVSGIVSLVLQGGTNAYNKVADINSDGLINVSDVSGIVSMTLSNAMSNKLEAPAAPASMTTYNEVASSVFIEPFQINPGEEKEILVNLNNPDLGVISFQFDLTLPEGLEIVYEEEDGEKYFFVDKGSRLPRSYQVESTQFTDGKYRILAYSNKNDLVRGTSGDIVTITVKAAETMPDGIYTINFVETVLTKEVDGESVSVYPENTSCAVSVGNATGIEGVDAAAARQTIYDLQGRPTDAKQRGIYIINGKKVIK